MGILTQVRKPVYRTTDGKEFASGENAADHQVFVSLGEMMREGRFAPSPGVGGKWDWGSVVRFIADNREELRIMLEGVRPINANDED